MVMCINIVNRTDDNMAITAIMTCMVTNLIMITSNKHAVITVNTIRIIIIINIMVLIIIRCIVVGSIMIVLTSMHSMYITISIISTTCVSPGP